MDKNVLLGGLIRDAITAREKSVAAFEESKEFYRKQYESYVEEIGKMNKELGLLYQSVREVDEAAGLR